MRRSRWRWVFWSAFAVVGAALLLPVPAALEDAAGSARGSDKLVHVALFGVLAWSGRHAFPDLSRWVLFVSLVAYGAVTEALQAFVPGRAPEVVDVLADAAGAGLALVVSWRRERVARASRPEVGFRRRGA